MVLTFFLVFSWLGGWRQFGDGEPTVLFWLPRVLFGLSLVACLWPLRHFEAPSSEEIVRHIEDRSGLENRPMTAQTDAIAMGGTDVFATALWREHQERMSAKLKDMTAGMPAPDAQRFDPVALRAMLPVLAFAAFAFSFSSNGGRIGDVLGLPSIKAEVPVRMDAWINPPRYTRKSPVFLSAKTGEDGSALQTVTVPESSEFFLRFIGEGEIKVLVGDVGSEVELLPKEESKDDRQLEFTSVIEEDSVIRLMHQGKELAQWGIALVPDMPPEVSFFEHPSAALSGSLQLTYTVQDDYGIVKGNAEIKSLEPVADGARPLIGAPEVPLSVPRTRGKKAVSKLNKDLTDHPWAGGKISIMLSVTDDAGQTGQTETREMTMPGRRFAKPLALALVEQRRTLAMDANQQRHVANLLDAVSGVAPEYVEDTNSVLAMRVAYRRLVDARTDDELRSVLDLLWEIALGVEFGDLSEAERRLREAQENLSEALENGASDEEIDRLMKELREAMNEMMQALAEQARKNPQAQNPFDQNDMQTLTQNDLQNMMDRIEDLAKSGSKDAARQMLSELQRMMDNLRSGRHEQQRQAEGNELNRSLDKLSELMQRQQELMNETYRMQRRQQQLNRQQGQQQQGQNSQNQQQQGQRQGQQNGDQLGQQQNGQQGDQGNEGLNRPMTAEELADALRQLREQQQALEQQLSELGQQLEELGLGPSQELGEAQSQMGEAGENLGDGKPGEAGRNQGQALEALRRGAQNMMEQMAGDRQQGGQQQAEQNGQGQAGERRGSDPLGRQTGSDGLNAGSDVEVPGEIDAQRARRILEAIRDRLAIPDNPIIEKDYLERLLKTE